MSEQTEATRLLWAYVEAEKRIEEAENTIRESKSEKNSLLVEISNHNNLGEALGEYGVICNGRLCVLDEDSGSILIEPEPASIYSIKDEEPGDE